MVARLQIILLLNLEYVSNSRLVLRKTLNINEVADPVTVLRDLNN